MANRKRPDNAPADEDGSRRTVEREFPRGTAPEGHPEAISTERAVPRGCEVEVIGDAEADSDG